MSLYHPLLFGTAGMTGRQVVDVIGATYRKVGHGITTTGCTARSIGSDKITGMYREYVCSVAVHEQIFNEVRRIDNFRALARKLSFLPTELDIFYTWQQYIRILFIFQHLTC